MYKEDKEFEENVEQVSDGGSPAPAPAPTGSPSKVRRVRKAVRDRSIIALLQALTNQTPDLLQTFVRQSARLKPHRRKNVPIGASKFGGLPDVPSTFEWPIYGRPLSFFCQLNLADLHLDIGLPTAGMLYFFLDAADVPIGEMIEQPKWRVLFAESNPAAPLSRASSPGRCQIFKERMMGLFPEDTMCDSMNVDTFEIPVSVYDFDDLDSALNQIYEKGAVHRVGGYPQCIGRQTVERDCHFYLDWQPNHLDWRPNHWPPDEDQDQYQDPDDYEDIKTSREQERKWRLLLQVDNDKTVGTAWGNVDRMYFMIKEEDLRDRRFDKVWFVSQFADSI